jgi:hypothetical protein
MMAAPTNREGLFRSLKTEFSIINHRVTTFIKRKIIV